MPNKRQSRIGKLLMVAGATALASSPKASAKQVWELTGRPLEQILANDANVDDAYQRHSNDRAFYFPDCGQVSFINGNRSEEDVKLEPGYKRRFDSWMERWWTNPDSVTAGTCNNGVCIFNIYPNVDCAEVNIANSEKTVNIFGGTVNINLEKTKKASEQTPLSRTTPPWKQPSPAANTQPAEKFKEKRRDQAIPQDRTTEQPSKVSFSILPQVLFSMKTYKETPMARDTQAKLVEVYHGNDIHHNYLDLKSFPVIASMQYGFMQVYGTILPATFAKGPTSTEQMAYYYLNGNLGWGETYSRKEWMIGMDAVIPIRRGISASLLATIGTALDFSTIELQADNWEDTNPPGYTFNENPIKRKEKSSPHLRLGIEVESRRKFLGGTIAGGIVGDYSKRTINGLASENYLIGTMPPHEDTMTWNNFDMAMYVKLNFRKG